MKEAPKRRHHQAQRPQPQQTQQEQPNIETSAGQSQSTTAQQEQHPPNLGPMNNLHMMYVPSMDDKLDIIVGMLHQQANSNQVLIQTLQQYIGAVSTTPVMNMLTTQHQQAMESIDGMKKEITTLKEKMVIWDENILPDIMERLPVPIVHTPPSTPMRTLGEGSGEQSNESGGQRDAAVGEDQPMHASPESTIPAQSPILMRLRERSEGSRARALRPFGC